MQKSYQRNPHITSDISSTLAGNKIVGYSNVVSALLQLHLHSQLKTWFQYKDNCKDNCKTRETTKFWNL